MAKAAAAPSALVTEPAPETAAAPVPALLVNLSLDEWVSQNSALWTGRPAAGQIAFYLTRLKEALSSI